MSNEMVTQLPTVAAATLADIIYAVQGGVSVQETLSQVMNLSLANTVLNYAGNPNGYLAKIVDASLSASAVTLLNPQNSGANFQFQFLTQAGFTHNILYRTNLVVGTWRTNSTVTGNGTITNISLPYSLFSPSKQGFIRVSTQ